MMYHLIPLTIPRWLSKGYARGLKGAGIAKFGQNHTFSAIPSTKTQSRPRQKTTVRGMRPVIIASLQRRTISQKASRNPAIAAAARWCYTLQWVKFCVRSADAVGVESGKMMHSTGK
jgi:hypothetical protein